MSTTARAEPSTAPPRACLACLPRELKLRILEMSKAQDVAYQVRKRTKSRDEPSGPPSARPYGLAYGNSLVALSTVNKEMRNLGESLLFATLNTTRAVAHVFHTTIFFQHASRFTTLSLSTLPGFAQTLVLIPSLVNLKELVLHFAVFGATKSLPYTGPLPCDAPFKFHGSRIHSLQLHDFDARFAAKVIPYFPNLSSVQLYRFRDAHVARKEEDEVDDYAELGQCLRQLHQLERFEFRTVSGWGVRAPDGSPAAFWSALSNITPLRHVSIRVNTLSVDIVNFLSAVAPGLESLRLKFKDVHEESVDLQAFPKLTSLHLSAHVPDVVYFLTHLAPSPIRQLSISLMLELLDLSVTPPPIEQTAELMNLILPDGLLYNLLDARQHPVRTLNSFRIGTEWDNTNKIRISPHLSKALQNLQNDLSIDRYVYSRTPDEPVQFEVFNAPSRLNFHPLSRESRAWGKLAVQEMDKVFDYGKRVSRRARETGDTGTLVRMVRELKAFRVMYEEELD